VKRFIYERIILHCMNRKTAIGGFFGAVAVGLAIAKLLFSSPDPANIEKMHNKTSNPSAAAVSTATQQPPDPIAYETVSIDNVFVASSVNGGHATTDNKLVEYDDNVELHAVVKADLGGRNVYFTDAESLVIDGNPVPDEQIVSLDYKSDEVDIKWFKVESDSKGKSYSNTIPKWHWDKLDYAATAIDDFNDEWSVSADVSPTILDPVELDGKAVGTMRYQVVFEHNGENHSSPGEESRYKGGVSRAVHRISRKGNTGNDVVDAGFAMCNNPYIWGSASWTGSKFHNQAEEFVGADCADYAVAAHRLAGNWDLWYGCTKTLPEEADVVAEPKYILMPEGVFLDKDGKPVPIGEGGVRIDDIILWYRHTGILVNDQSNPDGENSGDANGVLDEHDTVLHTLFAEPRPEPIGEAYGGVFRVMRLKEEK